MKGAYMESSAVAPRQGEGASMQEGDQTQYSIEHEDFFTIKNKEGFQFYTVDIKNVDISKIKTIIEACEKVESECWKAQEDFYAYFIERDLVTYIVKDHKIVGFQLVAYWEFERYVVFSLDETMVLSQFRGNRLGLTLCTLSARSIFTIFSKKEKVRFVGLSITPNPHAIMGFYKYRALFRVMKNTFNPSKDLLMIYNKLLFRKKASLVNKDYPYFFKNMFPGSLGAFEVDRLPDAVKKMIPPEIDFFERGDAFVFMVIFSKMNIWLPLTAMLLNRFGWKYLFNDHLGFFRKNKRISIPES